MPICRSAVAVAAVSLFLVPLVAGCGGSDADDAAQRAEITRLTAAVDGLTDSNESLRNELRLQARQLDGLSRDVAAARGTPAGSSAGRRAGAGDGSEEDSAKTVATGEGAGEGEPAVDPDAPLDEEGAVDALLATEAGRKVIQKAAAAEIAKREERDRRSFVSYTIGVFARDAQLDERQTRELQRVWKESLDGGVKLRKQFAAVRALPEDQRKEARAKAMESMRNLGRRREEQVNELLSQKQLEQYEKAEDEIVASLHGGPRRPSPERKNAADGEE